MVIIIMFLHIFLIIQFILLIFSSKVNASCQPYSLYFEDDDHWENNYLQCEFSPRTPVVLINNFKKTVIEDSKPFSSACAQCTICLTIAEELDKLFKSHYIKYPPHTVQNTCEFNKKVRQFCDSQFKNYDFREEKGSRKLINDLKSTKHVHSTEDGLWPNKLKEMCHKYLDVAGEFYLYKRWYEISHLPNFEMSDILCRSFGLFQHCRNVIDKIKQGVTTFRTS